MGVRSRDILDKWRRFSSISSPCVPLLGLLPRDESQDAPVFLWWHLTLPRVLSSEDLVRTRVGNSHHWVAFLSPRDPQILHQDSWQQEVPKEAKPNSIWISGQKAEHLLVILFLKVIKPEGHKGETESVVSGHIGRYKCLRVGQHDYKDWGLSSLTAMPTILPPPSLKTITE